MKKKRAVDVASSKLSKRGDYTEVLEAIDSGAFCPFCEENLFKHHRKPTLFKTKHWLVTENAWPYAGSRHHFLLITKKHVERAEDARGAVLADLHVVYERLVRDYGLKGATLVMRSGDSAYTGATVQHLHAQILSGSKRTKQTVPLTAVVGFKKP